MRTLNDFVRQDQPRDDAEWTPAIGFRRGATYGLVATAALAILLIPIAAYLPYMLLVLWLRIPLAFGLAWLLCRIVERGAGMVAGRCTLLAIGLAALVLVSNHVVFALHGVLHVGGGTDYDGLGFFAAGAIDWWVFPMGLIELVVPAQGDLLIGWQWCHPYALLCLNGLPLVIAAGFCTALSDRP